MSKRCSVLAADIGAGSVKTFRVSFDGSRIETSEIHRFPNSPLALRQHLYNNIGQIYDQVKRSFLQATMLADSPFLSAGIDTFGNDYALLNRRDELIGLPYSYRDARTADYEKRLAGTPLADKRLHYTMTGIPPAPSTAYNQLLAEAAAMEKNELENADAFLMLPDLIGFFLTGEKSSEYVATSTSSLLDVSTGDWSEPVLATLPFSRSIFKNIVGPGTHCGPINDPELETFRDKNIGLIKTAGHDSGSAVVSIPLTKADAIYVSSGSWSLIGVEAAKPVTTGEAYRYGFSNQGLPEGNFRVQRAIPGLWIIQQCLKEWQVSQAGLTFAGVEKMADDHSGFSAYVDVEQPAFSQPGNMTEKIREYCRVTGQKVPESAGEIASCIYSSLALKYKTAAAQLDSLFGHVFTNIYIVGGGARDAGLAARVASAASKTVLTGLYDASAMGNGLVQLIAHGHIRDISQAREIVSNSYALSRFEPGDAEPWNFALAHARQIEETYKSRVPDSLPQV